MTWLLIRHAVITARTFRRTLWDESFTVEYPEEPPSGSTCVVLKDLHHYDDGEYLLSDLREEGPFDEIRRFRCLETLSVIVHSFNGFKITFNAPLHTLLPAMQTRDWSRRKGGDYCLKPLNSWKEKIVEKRKRQLKWKEPTVRFVTIMSE